MPDDDTIRIRVHVTYGWVGAEDEDVIEYDRAEWEQLTEKQREDKVQMDIDVMIENRVDAGWEVVEG